jgi:hypothetical protein
MNGAKQSAPLYMARQPARYPLGLAFCFECFGYENYFVQYQWAAGQAASA